MMDYGDVRVLIQEAEAFAIYHSVLREDAGRFGQDFLGRVLPGCLVPAFAQSQAHRKRRMLVEQMARVLQSVDALVTVGSGPAPRFDARETHGFLYGLWSDKPNLLAPFSVTGFLRYRCAMASPPTAYPPRCRSRAAPGTMPPYCESAMPFSESPTGTSAIPQTPRALGPSRSRRPSPQKPSTHRPLPGPMHAWLTPISDSPPRNARSCCRQRLASSA